MTDIGSKARSLIHCYAVGMWQSPRQASMHTCLCVLVLFVTYVPSTVSRISITGCLGSPIMTSAGPALTMSALKNSEFSGMKSSMIFRVYSCRVLPAGKVISKGSLGV